MLTEAHKTKLASVYGIDPEKTTQLISLNPSDIETRFGFQVEGGGIGILYNPTALLAEQTLRVRLDNPVKNPQTGKTAKYLSPSGQQNRLFVPEGVTLQESRLIITEGEFKALAAAQHGIPCVALSGIWNWKIGSQVECFKLSDRDSLLPELKRNWRGQSFILIYDSDITPKHPAWTAFPRFAEQLYALGADSVKIVTLPGGAP